MRFFLINLEKNAERLSFMKEQFDSAGVEFERINAIYGKTLSGAERKRGFSSMRSLVAMRRRLSDGELGCAMSHVLAYRKMVEESIPAACIFEDDVSIGGRFWDVLRMTENRIDSARPQAVVFSGYHIEGAEDMPFGLKSEKAIWCADAYLLTLPAAKLLLKANDPVITVADAFKRWRRYFGLELYHAFPSSVSQVNERFGSDLSIPSKVSWVLRQFLWLVDFALIKATGR